MQIDAGKATSCFATKGAQIDRPSVKRGCPREVVEAGLLPASLDLSTSESPRFVGRAVVALASDSHVARWTGRAVAARDLADEYGFTDVDGRLPAGPLRHRTP